MISIRHNVAHRKLVLCIYKTNIETWLGSVDSVSYGLDLSYLIYKSTLDEIAREYCTFGYLRDIEWNQRDLSLWKPVRHSIHGTKY